MNGITIECDRCHQQVDGLESTEATAGFYNVSEPSVWAKYANEGERRVCDSCMFADQRYIADYGKR